MTGNYLLFRRPLHLSLLNGKNNGYPSPAQERGKLFRAMEFIISSRANRAWIMASCKLAASIFSWIYPRSSQSIKIGSNQVIFID